LTQIKERRRWRWQRLGMSFLRYLDTLTVTDTPCGNFVDDAQRDCQMPNVQSWPELQEYLRRTGWFDSAIQAAQLVWRDYEATIAEAA
jgi:hypothetical protein